MAETRSAINPYLLYLVFVTTLGPLQFGYHLSELNVPEKAIRCPSTSELGFLSHWGLKGKDAGGLPSCIPMDEAQYAIVSSVYTLGGFIGALSAGPLSSRKGRRLPLRLTSPLFCIGSVMASVAKDIPTFAIGRFLAGLGAGAAMVVGPVYISEIAPVGFKGTLGASTQVMTNIGILLTQTLGYFLGYGSMWRIVLAVGAGVAALQFLGLFGMTESHEWLGAKGDAAAAKRALHKIRRGRLTDDETRRWGSGEPDDERESLLAPSSPVADARNPQARESIGILQVLVHPEHYRAVIAVVLVMLSQQLCGINSVIVYSVHFLSDLLPTSAGPITVSVGALNLVVTILCAPLADRLGRKVCLLLSIAGMGLNAFLLAFSIMFGLQVLSAVATLLFVASFAVGLGPVPFILASELVGPEAVGATQSIALGVNWIATYLVTQFFPVLNAAMGNGKVFFIFGSLAVAFFAVISKWVPESKGKANADEVWGRERRVD